MGISSDWFIENAGSGIEFVKIVGSKIVYCNALVMFLATIP